MAHNGIIKKEDAKKYLKSLITEASGFRKRAFEIALKKIEEYSEEEIEIETLGEGFGKGIKDRFQEIANTGKLKEVEKQINKNIILEKFQEIMGVGIVKAQEWWEQGIRSIDDVKELYKNGVLSLTSTQKLGLKYLEEFKYKIPRSEIDLIDIEIKKVLKCYNKEWRNSSFSNPPKLKHIIAGSYRRGKNMSGDIDCILYNENGDMNIVEGEMNGEQIIISPIDDFLLYFSKIKILTNVIAKGNVKILAVVKIGDSPHRRIDFEITNKKSLPYALFYFTGSMDFNIKMRGKAKSMGYHLDQRTLTNIETGKSVWMDSEESIMEFLEEEYKFPEER